MMKLKKSGGHLFHVLNWRHWQCGSELTFLWDPTDSLLKGSGPGGSHQTASQSHPQSSIAGSSLHLKIMKNEKKISLPPSSCLSIQYDASAIKGQLWFLHPPALLMRTSSRSSFARISLAKWRTDSRDARSSFLTITLLFPLFFLTSCAALFALSMSLQAKIIRAPEHSSEL